MGANSIWLPPNNPLISSNDISMFLVQAMLILSIVMVLRLFMKKYLKSPAVIAELLTGLILGPNIFGMISESAQSALFNSYLPEGSTTTINSLDNLKLVSYTGLVMYMFLLGYSQNAEDLLVKYRSRALKAGSIGLIFPAIWNGLLAMYLLKDGHDGEPPFAYIANSDDDDEDDDETGIPSVFPFVLLFIVVMSITSLSVSGRILSETKYFYSSLGITVIASAAYNDIIAWLSVAIVLSSIASANDSIYYKILPVLVLITTLVVIFFLLYVVKPILSHLVRIRLTYKNTQSTKMITIFTAIIVIYFIAFLFQAMGLDAILGALIAGLVIPKNDPFLVKSLTEMERYVSEIFVPIYFSTAGLKVNFINFSRPWLIPVVLITSFLAKSSSGLLGAYVAGCRKREIWATGCCLNAKGLTEVVILQIGSENGLFNNELYSLMFLYILCSSFTVNPLFRLIMGKNGPKYDPNDGSALDDDALSIESQMKNLDSNREYTSQDFMVDVNNSINNNNNNNNNSNNDSSRDRHGEWGNGEEKRTKSNPESKRKNLNLWYDNNHHIIGGSNSPRESDRRSSGSAKDFYHYYGYGFGYGQTFRQEKLIPQKVVDTSFCDDFKQDDLIMQEQQQQHNNNFGNYNYSYSKDKLKGKKSIFKASYTRHRLHSLYEKDYFNQSISMLTIIDRPSDLSPVVQLLDLLNCRGRKDHYINSTDNTFMQSTFTDTLVVLNLEETTTISSQPCIETWFGVGSSKAIETPTLFAAFKEESGFSSDYLRRRRLKRKKVQRRPSQEQQSQSNRNSTNSTNSTSSNQQQQPPLNTSLLEDKIKTSPGMAARRAFRESFESLRSMTGMETVFPQPSSNNSNLQQQQQSTIVNTHFNGNLYAELDYSCRVYTRPEYFALGVYVDMIASASISYSDPFLQMDSTTGNPGIRNRAFFPSTGKNHAILKKRRHMTYDLHTSLINTENIKKDTSKEILRKAIRVYAKIILLPYDRDLLYGAALTELVNQGNPGSIVFSTQRASSQSLLNLFPSPSSLNSSLLNGDLQSSCKHIMACCVLIDIDSNSSYTKEDIKFLTYVNTNTKALLEFLIALAESEFTACTTNSNSNNNGNEGGKEEDSTNQTSRQRQKSYGLLLNIKFVNEIFTSNTIKEIYHLHNLDYFDDEDRSHDSASATNRSSNGTRSKESGSLELDDYSESNNNNRVSIDINMQKLNIDHNHNTNDSNLTDDNASKQSSSSSFVAPMQHEIKKLLEILTTIADESLEYDEEDGNLDQDNKKNNKNNNKDKEGEIKSNARKKNKDNGVLVDIEVIHTFDDVLPELIGNNALYHYFTTHQRHSNTTSSGSSKNTNRHTFSDEEGSHSHRQGPWPAVDLFLYNYMGVETMKGVPSKGSSGHREGLLKKLGNIGQDIGNMLFTKKNNTNKNNHDDSAIGGEVPSGWTDSPFIPSDFPSGIPSTNGQEPTTNSANFDTNSRDKGSLRISGYTAGLGGLDNISEQSAKDYIADSILAMSGRKHVQQWVKEFPYLNVNILEVHSSVFGSLKSEKGKNNSSKRSYFPQSLTPTPTPKRTKDLQLKKESLQEKLI